VREKGARRFRDCLEEIKRHEALIKDYSNELDVLRKEIAEVEKEINEGGASLANLRDNLRVRKLRAEITATIEELESMDMEEAAKAKRNFDEKFPAEQKRENDLSAQVFNHSTYLLDVVFHINTECLYRRRAQLAQGAA
jgi:DNA repair protein RAD50